MTFSFSNPLSQSRWTLICPSESKTPTLSLGVRASTCSRCWIGDDRAYSPNCFATHSGGALNRGSVFNLSSGSVHASCISFSHAHRTAAFTPIFSNLRFSFSASFACASHIRRSWPARQNPRVPSGRREMVLQKVNCFHCLTR